jgi:hypothetical protein
MIQNMEKIHKATIVYCIMWVKLHFVIIYQANFHLSDWAINITGVWWTFRTAPWQTNFWICPATRFCQ